MSTAQPDWAAEDLRWVVERGLERGADLLTAGEQCIALRIARLTGAEAHVYARLTARVPEVFRTTDLPDVPDSGCSHR